ncbi:MAG: hypothetical protein KatS3mg013_1215 [Actinomycetota bacterium]|nr:MAG: hypothetical protein KatS3mg013_1215 [Actinomycetota bacterium]
MERICSSISEPGTLRVVLIVSSTERTAGKVVTADGISLFRRVRVRAEDDRWTAEVSVSYDEELGRMVAERLEVRGIGAPVTPELLRKVPLKRLVAHGAFRAAGADLFGDPTSAAYLVGRVLGVDPVEIAAKGPTDEALRITAAVYRIAYLAGLRPTNVVAAAMKIPRSTAGRWVMTARRRGFLAPTTRGKARA